MGRDVWISSLTRTAIKRRQYRGRAQPRQAGKPDLLVRLLFNVSRLMCHFYERSLLVK